MNHSRSPWACLVLLPFLAVAPSLRAADATQLANYTHTEMPRPGANTLNILSPTLLELVRINAKPTSASAVDSWNFVSGSTFTAPATSKFALTVAGQSIPVQSVGFKRRPLYAPLARRDLRVDNRLYLRINTPITDGQEVVVKNPDGTLWPGSMVYKATADPLRYSPTIHVNQEGYIPSFSKKAFVGQYLGNLGEMDLTTFTTFKIVKALTGEQIYSGSLVSRKDVGFKSPYPYQKVLEADFSSFNTPGYYKLTVAGLGASLPFEINDGIAMNFTRTYATGLYNQRSGTAITFPYTRHIHGLSHMAQVDVPLPETSFTTAWSLIANATSDYASNPKHTAPQLKNAASQRYPFQRTGKIDASGGHHDAGDYSKYTINVAQLIHHLVFAADAFPQVGAMDNLGIPESGDGKSDFLQEAKWEADFLAKLQDTDGGFYFLVYPKARAYEDNVLPDAGDPQIVWPKNTSATAAAVAALAEIGSSPLFKAQYPTQAAAYLIKAKAGWDFLSSAIATYGKDGSYQKLTHYGDVFMHDDELAWAASAMYAATGDPVYQTKLFSWYPDPTAASTRRWGWVYLFEGYGGACRTYAFAAKTGRLLASKLDATYLSKCNTEIQSAGNVARDRAKNTAYGTSMASNEKAYNDAGWYFSGDRAFDLAVAYQLNASAEYITGILTNMNYEGGCNPVNVTYLTGLGWKRQREIVSQYGLNDTRTMPPSGLPIGNIVGYFASSYGSYPTNELKNLVYPLDGSATTSHPLYDRWGDSFNVATVEISLPFT